MEPIEKAKPEKAGLGESQPRSLFPKGKEFIPTSGWELGILVRQAPPPGQNIPLLHWPPAFRLGLDFMFLQSGGAD